MLGLGFRISEAPFQVDYLPIDEDHPLRPEDTYSLSKVLDEELLKAFSRAYNIDCIALRLMGVDYPHWRRIPFDTTPQPTQGQQTPFGAFQYVEAEDVALACRLALEKDDIRGFEAFYIGTDTFLAEDTAVVLKRLYPDLAATWADRFEGKAGLIGIEKARRLLGIAPQHSWRPSED